MIRNLLMKRVATTVKPEIVAGQMASLWKSTVGPVAKEMQIQKVALRSQTVAEQRSLMERGSPVILALLADESRRERRWLRPLMAVVAPVQVS